MRAALLALLGFFCYTLMDLSIKWLLQVYPLMQVVFLNALFALVGILVLVFAGRSGHVLKTRRPGLHFRRALMLIVGDALAFYAYGELPLADAYSLVLTLPLFTTLGALMLGYEAASFYRIVLMALGFVGVLVVLSPNFGVPEFAMLCALGCAVVEAFAFLVVVKHKDGEHPLAFAVYSLGTMALVAICWPGWTLAGMTATAWGVSLAGGVAYACATASVLYAFRSGSPSLVSSMQYSQLLWGILFGFLLWGDVPSWSALMGGAIIAVSGVLLVRHGHKSDRAEAALPPEESQITTQH